MAKDDLKKSLSGMMFNQKAVNPDTEDEKLDAAIEMDDNQVPSGEMAEPVVPSKASATKIKGKVKAKTKKTVRKASSASIKKLPTNTDRENEKKDKKRAFTLQMSESLHERIAYYVENYAIGRGNSIAKILTEGAERLMDDLEKKAGIKR